MKIIYAFVLVLWAVGAQAQIQGAGALPCSDFNKGVISDTVLRQTVAWVQGYASAWGERNEARASQTYTNAKELSGWLYGYCLRNNSKYINDAAAAFISERTSTAANR